jgi:hypothetical protein
LKGQYKNLVMVPPSFQMHERACPMQPLPIGTWAQMAKVAYENQLSYNSAPLSRANEEGIAAYCAGLQRTLLAGDFDPETVYAVSSAYLQFFTEPAHDMVCARANQWHMCARRSRPTTLQSALSLKTQTSVY